MILHKKEVVVKRKVTYAALKEARRHEGAKKRRC
jgi:hypothetical protein